MASDSRNVASPLTRAKLKRGLINKNEVEEQYISFQKNSKANNLYRKVQTPRLQGGRNRRQYSKIRSKTRSSTAARIKETNLTANHHLTESSSPNRHVSVADEENVRNLN